MLEEELENGLKILIEPRPERNVTALKLNVKAGSMHQEEDNQGIMHLIEHLFLNGSEKYPKERDISRRISGKGGYFNAVTGFDYTGLDGLVSKKHQEELLEISLDAMFRSKLNKLENEKKVVCNEIEMMDDDPENQGWDLLSRMMYKNHHLMKIDGKKEIVKSLSKQEVQRKYKELFHPANAFLVLVGPVDPEEVIGKVEKYTQGLGTSKTVKRNKLMPLNCPGRKELEKDVNLSYVTVGSHTPGCKNNRNYWRMELVKAILGDNRSDVGRLFEKLRVEKGLVYSISSDFYSFSETGCLNTTFACSENKVEEALKTFNEEVEALNEISEEETEKYKTYLKGLNDRDRDDVSSESEKISDFNLLFDMDQLKQYDSQVDELTVEEIRKTIRKHLEPGKMHQSIVKPKSKD